MIGVSKNMCLRLKIEQSPIDYSIFSLCIWGSIKDVDNLAAFAMCLCTCRASV